MSDKNKQKLAIGAVDFALLFTGFGSSLSFVWESGKCGGKWMKSLIHLFKRAHYYQLP